MKIIIAIGLPASGKSTWAKAYCEKNTNWVRINRDDLRNMRGKYWLPKQEDLITAWENNAIEIALGQGYNVVLDATNLNKDRNKQRILDLKSRFPTLTHEYKDFTDVSVEECIKRDLGRANSVGESVIRGMYDKYLAPEPVKYVEDPTLPHCVIVDIDGTLADKNDRNPFDWKKVGEDTPREAVVDLVKLLSEAGKQIIIFSGRDRVCEAATLNWLVDNGIPYDGLAMRPEGNTMKDSVIKKEMFETLIRGKYYVDFVIDDRDSVISMWRKELGLNCFQVNYGNF